MNPSTTDDPLSSLLETILALLRGDLAPLVLKWMVPHLPRLLRRLRGMYEVLAYETQLELRDAEGREAHFTKHQKVLFLQDNIIAYQDQAWGDGEIFADYQCSPGYAVDRYRDGNKYRILISLREAKNRGDIEDFHIERTIRNGFMRPVEDFQADIDHSTRRLSMSVVFPQERAPKQVKVIEQKSQRTLDMKTDQFQRLPDGRWRVSWEKPNPKVGEVYLLRWAW